MNESDDRLWIDEYFYARNPNVDFTNEVDCDRMASPASTEPPLNDDDLPF